MIEKMQQRKAEIEQRMAQAAARGDVDAYHSALAELWALGPVPTGTDGDLVVYEIK